jgi:hypothetical protein
LQRVQSHHNDGNDAEPQKQVGWGDGGDGGNDFRSSSFIMNDNLLDQSPHHYVTKLSACRRAGDLSERPNRSPGTQSRNATIIVAT